jgi:hypothetical protein
MTHLTLKGIVLCNVLHTSSELGSSGFTAKEVVWEAASAVSHCPATATATAAASGRQKQV